MRILVNNNEVLLDDIQTNINALIEKLELTPVGIAIAIDNKLVIRSSWNTTFLEENNNVTIIKAACGG